MLLVPDVWSSLQQFVVSCGWESNYSSLIVTDPASNESHSGIPLSYLWVRARIMTLAANCVQVSHADTASDNDGDRDRKKRRVMCSYKWIFFQIRWNAMNFGISSLCLISFCKNILSSRQEHRQWSLQTPLGDQRKWSPQVDAGVWKTAEKMCQWQLTEQVDTAVCMS